MTTESPASTQAGNYFISNYPPFSCWTQEQVPAFLSHLHRASTLKTFGVYIHLPFCRHRCHYCYFRVYAGKNASAVDRYIEHLFRELKLQTKQPGWHEKTVSSIYFGGGSPSYLNMGQIAEIFDNLRNEIDCSRLEECTFECDPVSTTREKLALLKTLGVTRLTFGFQSFTPEVLRQSGRVVTPEECKRAYSNAREAGFNEINIDILAGLPGETINGWSDTVQQVLSLQPDCVTLYQLELTHNSGFYRMQKLGQSIDFPSWPQKRAWAKEAFSALKAAGYQMVSGYMAVKKPQSWRFAHIVENFWHGGDLLGLGESAFGHLAGGHYQNYSQQDDYYRAIDTGQLPIQRAYILSDEEKFRRELILQFKTGFIDESYFRSKFGMDVKKLFSAEFSQLVHEGHLLPPGDKISLTDEGLLLVDELLPRFYLQRHRVSRYT